MPDRHTVYFSEMALDLHTERDPLHIVERIAGHAQSALVCEDAGIMLFNGSGRIELGTTTSTRVLAVDREQLELKQGPCIDAMAGTDMFLIADTETDSRWPLWTPIVASLGLRSVLSVRLETNEREFGSLNLYDTAPGAFDRDDLAVAKIFAQHASVALAETNNETNLLLAMDARKTIGQAQGILMERYKIDPGAAFDVLRRYSQDTNTKLRLVAQMIIDRRDLPSLSDKVEG